MQRQVLNYVLTENGQNFPIYKIEGHNVNIHDLDYVKKHEHAKLYEVSYKLGFHRETIISTFKYATDDFRTLMFVNPDSPSRTIGIPIMNIYSCKVIG